MDTVSNIYGRVVIDDEVVVDLCSEEAGVSHDRGGEGERREGGEGREGEREGRKREEESHA
jgi:hypothetical protein